MSLSIPVFKLASGAKIPALAYGTGTAWSHRGRDEIDRRLVESIKTAIKLGYRHLDTAEIYATEKDVGVAIQECGVPREELFITHKIFIGNSLKDIPGTLRKSLAAMSLTHVDLYLLHAPFFSDPPLPTVWAGLESVVSSGLATHIGVSNFNVSQLSSLLSFAKIRPAVNQIEYNPYCQDVPLRDFCKANGILLAAYSPLAPVNKLPGGPVDGVVEELAKKHGVTPAQVLLKWVLQQDVLAVTTSSNEERLRAFGQLEGWTLSEEEIEKIRAEGAKVRHRLYWKKQYEEQEKAEKQN